LYEQAASRATKGMHSHGQSPARLSHRVLAAAADAVMSAAWRSVGMFEPELGVTPFRLPTF